jgi:hypothetical protein
VFSAEHYAAMVHGWCCFAAPLRDPASGLPLGVLDLSSTWERAHPMALATVRALALAAQAVLDASAPAACDGATGATAQVRVMGAREVSRAGVVLPLALRQAEIVALLALAPNGLGPEELHDQMYGEEPVSVTTTKAEVSHLRALLAGGITQRRYQLNDSITVDVSVLVDALRAGDTARVAELYSGPLLPTSESPMIREWREVLQVGVRDIAISSGHPQLADRLPYDEAVQHAAAAALDPADARASWAHARIARAART